MSDGSGPITPRSILGVRMVCAGALLFYDEDVQRHSAIARMLERFRCTRSSTYSTLASGRK